MASRLGKIDLKTLNIYSSQYRRQHGLHISANWLS